MRGGTVRKSVPKCRNSRRRLKAGGSQDWLPHSHVPYSLFCLPQTGSVSSRGPYNQACGIVFALLNPSPHILRAPGEGVPNRPKGSAGSDQQQVETCNLGGVPTQKAK